MKTLKIIGKISYWLVLICLILIAGFTAFTAVKLPNNYKMFVVMSGSMEPAIKTGSIVAVKPENTYVQGDIVTFKDSNNPQDSVTHRILSVNEDIENLPVFTTKGDANETPDMKELQVSQILGKLQFSVPYIGYVVNFAKTQTGLILLIVIPAVIIIYGELMSIKNEAKRLMIEKRNRKLSFKENIEEKIGEEIIEIEDVLKNKKKNSPQNE